jgi:hypothetical protein
MAQLPGGSVSRFKSKTQPTSKQIYLISNFATIGNMASTAPTLPVKRYKKTPLLATTRLNERLQPSSLAKIAAFEFSFFCVCILNYIFVFFLEFISEFGFWYAGESARNHSFIHFQILK